MTDKSWKAALTFGSAAMALMTAQPALAQQRSFNIPAGDARKSIPEFARQAGVQISAPTGKLRGVRTRAISGALDARAALRRMIEGTGLSIASDDGTMIVLRYSAQVYRAKSVTGTAQAGEGRAEAASSSEGPSPRSGDAGTTSSSGKATLQMAAAMAKAKKSSLPPSGVKSCFGMFQSASQS